MKHARDIDVLLVCPQCRAELAHVADAYICRAAACRRSYPVVENIPKFLIDDARVLTLEEWRAVVPQNGNGTIQN